MEIVKSVFQSKSKRYQFIRYCTVGTLAAGIHYGVYYLLQEYEMTNLNIAYTIGYVTSFICNFFLTSYFTFRSNPSLKRALGFGGSHLVNYLNTYGIVQFVPLFECRSGDSSLVCTRCGCSR